MTNVFAVVGQHRAEPGRLLLLGDDGRFYAYAANGRLTAVEPNAAWLLDEDGRPTEAEVEVRDSLRPSGVAGVLGRVRRGRDVRVADPAAFRLHGRPFPAFAFGFVLLPGTMAIAPTALAWALG